MITPANVARFANEWTWQADWTTPREVLDLVVSVSSVHVAVGHELVTIKSVDGAERWRTPLFAASSATQGVLVARNPAAPSW